MALQLGCRSDDLYRTGGVTDPPARHGVRFRHTIDHHRSLFHIRVDSSHIGEGYSIIENFFVNVVRYGQHIILNKDFHQFHQFCLSIDRTCGVGRAVDDDGPGSGIDDFLQLTRSDFESIGYVCFQNDRLCARQDDDIRIGNPVRRGNDDLIALFEEHLSQIIKSMFRTAGYHNLRTGIIQFVIPVELADDSIFQLVDPSDRGVLGESLFNRLNSRLFHVIRRIKIRLAGAEPDDVPALCTQGIGLHGNRQGGRRFDAVNSC